MKVAVAALFVAVLVATGTTRSAASQSASLTVRTAAPVVGQTIYGWGLGQPGAVASDGAHLWVVSNLDANAQDPQTFAGTALVELSASTGAFRRISRAVVGPTLLADVGPHLWVVDSSGRLHELSAVTGAIERTTSGSGFFDVPTVLVANRDVVWIADNDNDLMEYQAWTGAFLRHVTLPHGVSDTVAMSIVGSNLWVLDQSTRGATLLNAMTGALVRRLDSADLGYPTSLATDGKDVWLTNTPRYAQKSATDNTVAELSAATQRPVRLLRGYGFNNPVASVLDGSFVLVANAGGTSGQNVGPNASVTVLRASDDALVGRIGLPYGADLPEGVTATAGRVWVDEELGDGVRQLDVADGRIARVVLESSYEFDGAGAIASSGTDVWTRSAGAVTEVSTANGALVRVIPGATFGDSWGPIAADDADVWLLDPASGAITELSEATGAVVRLVRGSADALLGATSIAADGTHVWVANPAGAGGAGSVTELSATTGALVRVLSGVGYQFDDPSRLASDGDDVWVLNGAGSVTELSASTGAFVRLVTGSGQTFDAPTAIATDGADVWIADAGSPTCECAYQGAITELSAATGAVARVIPNVTNQPVAIASDGDDVWITECGCEYGYGWYGSVTELSAATGGLVATYGSVDVPEGVAIGGGRAWVADVAGDSLTAFGPMAASRQPARPPVIRVLHLGHEQRGDPA